MYRRDRLISSIATLFIILLMLYPVQTIIIAVVIVIAYLILTNMPGLTSSGISQANNGKEVRRREALKIARIYLSPYKDIWRNLKLSNKFCSIYLWADGKTITARELVQPRRSFRVTYSKVHLTDDLWDMFCMAFSYNTSFDGLVQLCNTYKVEISIESPIPASGNIQTTSTVLSQAKNSSDNKATLGQETVSEKVDINNASEVEITALPGISIVMAKKLVKKREEINGFKKVDDVILFLHVKPHIEKQLRELICVNKIKTSIKIKRNSERSIDI